MTSKEKAIEALNEIKYFEESWYRDLFPIIEKQLNQPTLDDAIAVVEKIKQSQNIVDWKPLSVRTYNVGINNEQFEDITNYEPIFDNQEFYDIILTALRGLKEGK